MAEYLAPGVYVEEVERGAAPLAGVSTSTAGFLGPTERGPEEPRMLTSFADYRRTYGSHLELDESYLAHAVQGFFANGGSRCFVGRVASEDDEISSGKIPLERPFADRLDPLLSVDEEQIEFSGVDYGNDAQQSIWLSHAGDEDEHEDIEIVLDESKKIETTLDDHAGFEVAWEDDTGAGEAQTIEAGDDTGKELEVTFEPAEEVWLHWARLTIDPGDGIAPVHVTLVGYNDEKTDDHRLAVSTEHVDFGTIEEGSDRTKTITLEHEVGDPIDVDDTESKIIGPDADEFEIEGSNDATLSDGSEPAEFGVTFDPEGIVGRKDATLLIDHDGDNAPVVVSLVGWNGAMGVEAVGPGVWGNHVALIIEDASMYEPGENDLFKLKVRYWRDGDDYETAMALDADTDNDDVPEPDAEEIYDDLSPHESSNNFYVNQVDGVSMLIDPEKKGKGRPDPDASPIWLSGGETAEVERDDYPGDATDPAEERTGLAGFETVDEIAILCIPDEHRHDVTDLLIDHCEQMDDRFAILQAEENPGQAANIKPPTDTDMGAFYYPWLKVRDPNTGMVENVPPGGHVAGIYARTDASRGVHKAPANEVVRGIHSLQRTVTDGEQEVLNPRGVNCIRAFSGRGIRVWGARTASSNPNWKYVNVRRLFLFLRGSIEEGTQWVVFEPNNEQLWSRVEQTIKNFLTDVWQDGALMGTSPDEAFFVTCDRTTMTQSDIEQGRLICEIGVAPTRPAEFVIFRISQWTAESG